MVNGRAPDADILLELVDIWYRARPAGTPIVHNLSWQILRGTTIALMGRSGSGKSTVLHLLAGLLAPERGLIKRHADLGDGCGRAVGMMFQDAHLITTCTVLENAMMRGLLSAAPYEMVRSKAYQLLERVGLANRALDYPDQLSGGEQQRVALARALWGAPAVLLLDEPTAHADEATRQCILEVLLETVASYGSTVVIATHDDEIARRMGKCYVLDDGVLLQRDIP